jgi:flagellin-like protein
MKGISSIIASILLLIITIGLAGTAYLFISGLLTGSINKVINVLDVSCNNGKITVILSNDGTANINSVSDIIVTVDGTVETNNFNTFSPSLIPPHSSALNTSAKTFPTNIYHTILVASPSNSVRSTVWC